MEFDGESIDTVMCDAFIHACRVRVVPQVTPGMSGNCGSWSRGCMVSILSTPQNRPVTRRLRRDELQ